MSTLDELVAQAEHEYGLSGWVVGGHPVREGLYQVKLYKEGRWAWCYFSLAHTWGWMAPCPDNALILARRPQVRRIHSFRGLASDPRPPVTGTQPQDPGAAIVGNHADTTDLRPHL